MHKKNKTPFRIACIAFVFSVICLVYVVRIINIRINAEPREYDDGSYVRRVSIQAVRGEIYDRNGSKLVSNKYTYDMVFDHDAMSGDRHERNLAIYQAALALKNTGNAEKRTSDSFPFDGTYPNYTYSAEAKDSESSTYYRLLKRIAQNELEEDSRKKKNELTASYLEGFYAEHPEQLPTEREITEYYLERYKLGEKNADGEQRYTDGQIDVILRVIYDMEVKDFSIYTPYVFAEDVDISFMSYVKEINVVGADFTVSASRVYNYPGYASHILGRTGQIYSEDWDYYNELGYEMDAIVGLDGCEKAFEEYLRGIDGTMVVVEDKNGRIIDQYVEVEPIAGKDVYLTIDIELQMAAEDGLKANVEYVNNTYGAESDAGALVATEPNSGEVLVLASYPTFDLTTFNLDYEELRSDPANPLYNRALDGLYTPGSTFKIGMAAAGLDSSTLEASTELQCKGIYTYYSDYQPKCWIYSGSHGNINATEAVKVSCNCFFYELGRQMGIETMNDYCRHYGLGEATGIELSEKTGILAGPDYREQNGLGAWKPGDTISAAIGQSDNNFTPLQLATYVSTVLNGGNRYSAHLLGSVREYGSQEAILESTPTIVDSLGFSDAVLDPIKEGMRQMVESSATVSRYMKDIPVTVGGKTGTAELGGSVRENGLFVCAAPYNDPDIVISAVIEHAGGGSYAAMTAARVLEEYYN